MRRVRHSKSGLFLIELIICILFFSFTAGICIQFFVKAHDKSQEAKNLYQAQQEASSMAEILEKDMDFTALAPNLKRYYPKLEQVEEKIYIYYNKDWKQCKKDEKVYWMEVTQKPEESNLKKLKVALYAKTSKKIPESEIYHLNLSICVQQSTLQKGGA